jgi:cytochrome c551
MSLRGIGIVLVLFVLGIAFSGFAAYSADTFQHKEEKKIDAEKLVQQNCASCHGKDLKGSGSAPNLVERGQQLSAETIAQIITDGVAPNMPPYAGGNLKDPQEINAVARYITTLGK